MTYRITDGVAGSQPIADVSTVQNHPFGKVVRAVDPTYGEASFIYVKGVSGAAAGTWVTYNSDDWTTKLLTAGDIGPVAILMSALDAATDFGWAMVHGKHPTALAGDVADNGNVFISTEPGTCDDAIVAGDRVWGAKWASADDTATTSAEVEIAWPFTNDALNAGTT